MYVQILSIASLRDMPSYSNPVKCNSSPSSKSSSNIFQLQKTVHCKPIDACPQRSLRYQENNDKNTMKGNDIKAKEM